MKIESNLIILSTGRNKYAFGGVIGLSGYNGIYGGYDEVLVDSELIKNQIPDEDDLTIEEQIEIAEYMIARWREFYNKVCKIKTAKPYKG